MAQTPLNGLRLYCVAAHDPTSAQGLAEDVRATDEELIRINEALEALQHVDQRLVQVVEMRFFAGMTEAEVADALGVADRTVRRDWEKAKLLLTATLR